MSESATETSAAVATATPAKTRTKSVDYKVFSRIHREVSDANGTVQDVIDKVFAETGIRMTVNNVTVKAANLRAEGGDIGKLKPKGKKRRDIAALNATLAANKAATEAGKTEQAAGEAAAAAETPAAS